VSEVATILLRWASTLGFPIIHFLEQKQMSGKPTNMSCGILKPVMTSLFQEIASRILQMYETVAPYTLPLQLAAHFPNPCLPNPYRLYCTKPTLAVATQKSTLAVPVQNLSKNIFPFPSIGP